MNLLFFGIYSDRAEYPRQKNLISGLQAVGAAVYECRYSMARTFQERFRSSTTVSGILRFLAKMLLSYPALTWRFFRAPKADCILLAYPGYFHAPLLTILRLIKNRNAILIYDAFLPLFETLVSDRKILRAGSLAARIIWFVDFFACKFADIVLVDTQAHGAYFYRKFHVPCHKIKSVFVGSTFPSFSAYQKPNSKKIDLTVTFIGTFIPLHGIEIILEAADYLRDQANIKFLVIGSGQLEDRMKGFAAEKRLCNVEFSGWIPPEEIGRALRSADIALGIFSKTDKALRVIPIKIYDICAAGVPFVTADTPAIREAFTHAENAYLVPAGEPKALADAIIALKGNLELRNRIAMGAHRLSRTTFSQEEICRHLLRVIQEKLT